MALRVGVDKRIVFGGVLIVLVGIGVLFLFVEMAKISEGIKSDREKARKDSQRVITIRDVDFDSSRFTIDRKGVSFLLW